MISFTRRIKYPNRNMPKKTKKSNYIYSVGRRKTASARVRLYPKKGPILVNDVPIEQYFPLEVYKTFYLEPFRITDTQEKYSASIKVIGSGKTGQLGAVVHGLSRALAKADEKKYRPLLKKRGFLTRDPRMKERRKPGLAQSARARKQSPKR
jgi:small subunit ribosomal protein S9